MRPLRLLLWGIVTAIAWALALAAFILSDLADNADAVACSLEDRP